MDLSKYFVENPQLCALCGGLCCKTYPGMYLSPYRFEEIYGKITSDNFLYLLEQNFLTFKVCMGVPIPMPKFTGKGCVFLTDSGCKLSSNKRPCECLLFVPVEDTVIEGEIRCYFTKEVSYLECFKEWEKYYSLKGIDYISFFLFE